MPRSRADRFLDAFHGVEALLRSRIGADRRLRFYDLVDEAAKHDAVVAAFQLDLKEFADLRNAIVHDGTGRAIANPYPATVTAIERIAEVLKSPPTLVNVIVVPEVQTCSLATAVLSAARAMRDGDFSQLPVIDHGSIRGLLTAETVTRYLASVPLDDLAGIAGAVVDDVLPHAERVDNFRIVGVTCTTFEAIDLFRSASDEGRSLDAILAVDGQRLATIATPYDMPRLLGASKLA